VTHDQQEAFAVADQVVIMSKGHIVQRGSPQKVYCCPSSPWVARFLGLTNLIPGRVVALDPVLVETSLGMLAPQEGEEVAVGQQVTVLIRPEAARLADDCTEAGAFLLEGTVRESSFRGGHYRLVLDHASGLELAFRLLSELTPMPQSGQTITLVLRPEAISIVAQASHVRTE
jgi:ABC-type Fe3+/spermidine/putrescine transport system ATPase subunit